MKSAKFTTATLFFAITALLLAACGGGGGGGGSTAVPTAPAAGVSITPDNAPLISAQVIRSADIIQGFLVVGDVLPSVQVNPSGTEFNYSDFFVQQLRRLPALALSSSDVSVTGIVIPTRREPCDFNHGSMLISGEVTDPNVLTVDDRITIQFFDCELAGIILNGTISMTITDLAGDFENEIPPYTLGVDVVLTVFSVEAGGQVAYADGDMSMLLSVNVINDENLVLSGNSLTAWSGSEVETLTNYNYDLTWEADSDYSIGLEGTLASTVIGGSVSFSTTTPTAIPTPFTGNEILDANPTAGALRITTSADASQALLSALNNGIDVYIEVDADGDGIYETLIQMTWAELEAL